MSCKVKYVTYIIFLFHIYIKQKEMNLNSNIRLIREMRGIFNKNRISMVV